MNALPEAIGIGYSPERVKLEEHHDEKVEENIRVTPANSETKLRPTELEVGLQMVVAREVMARRRAALSELAK